MTPSHGDPLSLLAHCAASWALRCLDPTLAQATRKSHGRQVQGSRGETWLLLLLLDQDKVRIARLVVAAQDGDREAFGELFERFERQVFAIALRRLGNFCEAQELCQDVFVQAMQKLDQLRVPESFGAWIASITNRMAINRAVRRSRRGGPSRACWRRPVQTIARR